MSGRGLCKKQQLVGEGDGYMPPPHATWHAKYGPGTRTRGVSKVWNWAEIGKGKDGIGRRCKKKRVGTSEMIGKMFGISEGLDQSQ